MLNGGDLEVYVRRSKTCQEGKWSIFHMSGKRMNGFSVPNAVCRYIDSLLWITCFQGCMEQEEERWWLMVTCIWDILC